MGKNKTRAWSITPNTTTRIVAGLFRSRNFVWDSDSRVAASYGVSWTQFLVLRALRFTKEDFVMSPTELYSATQASSSGMAKMLRGLTEKGLVERLPNPEDARSTLVRLTVKGADLVEEIIDQLVATNTELFADVLPEHDRVKLAELLERLSNSLENRKKGS
ncbi:MarR family winged helix-turn-helix transcriptional regulator [Falsiruegeria litorea]|uniref:MarR family winged helix-turn-helix transcriptional regulator n=1 Tax=Falsiruegeria litorea TaxID=1280831 RepID=UPI001A99F8B0|nr:MarR family transcriptional regulator [Falsiruegeria litorea]